MELETNGSFDTIFWPSEVVLHEKSKLFLFFSLTLNVLPVWRKIFQTIFAVNANKTAQQQAGGDTI